MRIGNWTIEAPKAGNLFLFDGTAISRKLADCENKDFAPFRMESYSLQAVTGAFGPTCDVQVTGRTIQKKNGYEVVRVAIAWINDGEENSECAAWMVANKLEWVD